MTGRPWRIDAVTDHLHVVPDADLVDHQLDDDCVCGPAAELQQRPDGDRWIVIHQALDGRE